MSTITIPASFDEAREKLQGIHALLTATNWERCAILAAYVRVGTQGNGVGQSKAKTSLTPRDFANLGIAGLKSKDTVRKFVQHFLDHFGRHPEPGEVIDLDSLGPWTAPKAKVTFKLSPAEKEIQAVTMLAEVVGVEQAFETVDMANAFYESDEGKKYTEGQTRLAVSQRNPADGECARTHQ
jgi:hypothetical protein